MSDVTPPAVVFVSLAAPLATAAVANLLAP